MAVAFVSEAMPVGTLFGGDRLFYVPDFQRPVSWDSKDAEALVSDLWMAIAAASAGDGPDQAYYFGNLVLTRPSAMPGFAGPGRSDRRPAHAIVDGQQRIVTFTILFAVLRDLIGDSDPWLAGMVANGAVPRVVAGAVEAQFLKTYVQDADSTHRRAGRGDRSSGVQKLRSIRRAVLDDFKGRSTDELRSFAHYLRDFCWISMVTAPDIESGFRVFATLNTRGRSLTESEVLKAVVLRRLPESERAGRTARWNDFRKRAKGAFEHLPSHIQSIYTPARYSILRDNLKLIDGPGGAAHYLEAIFFPLAETLIAVANASYRGGREAEVINRLLRYLNLLGTQEWIPPVLTFMTLNRDKPALIAAFLASFDRFMHGLLMARVARDKRVNRCKALTEIIIQTPGQMPPRKTLALSNDERRSAFHFAANDLHQRSSNICKLTLLRLSGAVDHGPLTCKCDEITIEHVLPKSPKASSQWLVSFPDADARQILTKRLGNLVLLLKDDNHGAKNMDFAEKQGVYFPKGQPSPFAVTNELMPLNEWTTETIAQRSEQLLARLADIWHIVPPEGGNGRIR